ncbi:hypothetical protein IWQ56_001552 [Coemansia nantahalensis]|uniref:Uncharacterized protein n=1 Tax=Coemansia helicoidea TaxID=1286919 RepID=A0ACC1KZ73_9FUNG|nr:hypothetical protein IWQ56_001552 [Coemansia nantahalensis]KAJ2797810.1 hypothetical protein H4R21_004172 [Coemansia helicoidea]
MSALSSLDLARRQRAIQRQAADRVSQVARFVLRQHARRQTPAPLVVGISGPQGSGKTTMVRLLAEHLAARHVRAVGFSLDDLYLPAAEQERVAQAGNRLLRFRGQPGTHDVELGRQTLAALARNQEPTALPAYDKSLRGGRGDRVAPRQWSQPPVDVVLFEGWCLGFRELDAAELGRFLGGVRGSDSPLFKHSRGFSDAELAEVNANLGAYERALYPLIDAWVWLRVTDVDLVFRWRKEQEDALAASGRPSLSDAQLEDFVARFMPGYEMALPKLDARGFVSSGRLPGPATLRLHLDPDRNVVATDHMP